MERRLLKTLPIENGQVVTLSYDVVGMVGGYYAGPFNCMVEGYGKNVTS